MGVSIQFSQSYHWLNSWILANVIQLAVQDFCDRFVDYRMDPGRRLYDQMLMAARKNQAAISGAPTCPLCGKPMLKRMQKKGRMQGREFWGCSDYPNCNGIRPLNPD